MANTYKPKIGIVTPVYNGAATIQRTISSLLNQSFPDWINIIVNDGSNDDTDKKIEKFHGNNRFLIINLAKNLGRPKARNIALEKAKELEVKYLAMLDADDLYYPDKLEWQYNYMESNPEITLVSCPIAYINGRYELEGILKGCDKRVDYYCKDYEDYIPVPHACSLIRVKDIGNCCFDEKMIYGQDQDFMAKILLGKKYSIIPRVSYLYNRQGSFSFKKYKQTQNLRFRSIKNLHKNKSNILKHFLLSQLKIKIVGILCLFKMEHFYLKGLIRLPNEEEERYHKLFLNSFLKKVDGKKD